MYCRQHGYPTAPLISYKITPPADQWGFGVPVRAVSTGGTQGVSGGVL